MAMATFSSFVIELHSCGFDIEARRPRQDSSIKRVVISRLG